MMRKVVKVVLWINILLILLFLVLATVFFAMTAGTRLQPEKLIDYNKTITIYDVDDNVIENAACTNGRQSVKLSQLNEHTIDAFIASEDREFYKHKGLNYKRIIKATYKNLTSMSFKEGASTISQQLIKNTHLNNQKTIKRKLQEIKLTKQLERRYSKSKILEMYLNSIYFGHNCYGLQRAANYYFNTPAEQLNLVQSATIVGLLTSPNNYSPLKNPEKCIARRNTVLKNMYQCGYIDKQQYNQAINTALNVVNGNQTYQNSDYISAVYEELDEILPETDIRYEELQIKTYLNQNIQKIIENEHFLYDGAIFIRNYDGEIVACRSTVGNAKRQIASIAKPLFVYAPALDKNKIQLFTKIKDEEINYNGYSPQNYDKKYHGDVTVEDSIKYSYNVPAVKTLNSLNLDDVANYADKMNIHLEEDDKNLALALGSIKKGLTLKQLCDAYSTFQNGGNFKKSFTIDEIRTKTGKLLYKRAINDTAVFTQATCSLINEALCETAKSGTAKKLNNLNIDVACKTGTCGDEEGNTDAYCISYTKDYCLGIWLGDKDNKKIQTTGGNDCCDIANSVLKQIYNNRKCPPLEKNADVEIIELDRDDYENNKIVICDDLCPKLNRISVKCNKNNLPNEKSVKFSNPSIKTPKIIVNTNNIELQLCQTKYYEYKVFRQNKHENKLIYCGKWKEKIIDTPPFGEYTYCIVPYYSSGKQIFEGEKTFLSKVNFNCINDGISQPEILFKDWLTE